MTPWFDYLADSEIAQRYMHRSVDVDFTAAMGVVRLYRQGSKLATEMLVEKLGEEG